ncbi:hypothetical protein ISS07_02365 [Candidatus Woesearchaeota archaeon]|nr:hypothetical protein [Candidatus Woesearchaeota archaeon]
MDKQGKQSLAIFGLASGSGIVGVLGVMGMALIYFDILPNAGKIAIAGAVIGGIIMMILGIIGIIMRMAK